MPCWPPPTHDRSSEYTADSSTTSEPSTAILPTSSLTSISRLRNRSG
jgi:hypothetical protein